jgi:hypothetical protein
MQTPDFDHAFGLLKHYIARRPRRGPFPLESAFTWSVLLAAQSASRIKGDMLEIGVEFGTSAFLLLDAIGPEEHLTLIDLVRTPEWDAGCRGPYREKTNYTFIEGNSRSLAPDLLPTDCRWIHVDGGHLYEHVQKDLELTADLLSADGILVLDDFFEIRWPDVTAAFIDFLRNDTRLTPFLLVNRKIYCARSAEASVNYQSVFSNFLDKYGDRVGDSRSWEAVELMGRELLVAKLGLSVQIEALEGE